MRLEIDALKPTPKGTWKKCDHAMQAVMVGTLSLYATRQSSVTNKTPLPDVGVYLDASWARLILNDTAMLSVGAKGINGAPKYPFVLVNWPDGGVMAGPHLTDLVAWIGKEARAGKKVEISCVGGHGRTGTLLAALAIRELHLTADAAIKYVRDTYCTEAIETLSQENLLRRWNGEPEMKPAPVTTPAKQANYLRPGGGHGYTCGCVLCVSAKEHPDDCNCNACQTLLSGFYGAF